MGDFSSQALDKQLFEIVDEDLARILEYIRNGEANANAIPPTTPYSRLAKDKGYIYIDRYIRARLLENARKTSLGMAKRSKKLVRDGQALEKNRLRQLNAREISLRTTKQSKMCPGDGQTFAKNSFGTTTRSRNLFQDGFTLEKTRSGQLNVRKSIRKN